MIITAIEDNKKNKYLKSVFVDCDFAFDIPVSYFKSFRYKVNDEITRDKIDYYNNEVMLPKIKKKALSYLLKRPYGEKELLCKLLSCGFDEKNSAFAVAFAVDCGYINDRDFARMYVFDALTIKKHSAKRIRYDLLRKGICEQYIEEFLEENKSEEINVLKNALSKKLSRIDTNNREDLNKVKMHFFRKGYSVSDVNKALAELMEDN